MCNMVAYLKLLICCLIQRKMPEIVIQTNQFSYQIALPLFIILAISYIIGSNTPEQMNKLFTLSFSIFPRTTHFANNYCKLTNHYSFAFSNAKKDKDGSEKQRVGKAPQKQSSKASKHGKSYNLEGIDFNKLPQHLKKAYIIRKQTHSLQVPSEAELQNSIIINEIKRQRKQIEQQTEEPVERDNEGMPKRIFLQTFLLGLTGTNALLAAMLSFPVIPNHYFWLGVYSSSVLYPSLLATTCLCIGVNLAYLVFRQGLSMNTKIQDLKYLNLTAAPLSYYLQMALLSLQVFSLATSVSLPLLIGLPQNYKSYVAYGIMFLLLSANAHSTLQQRSFSNPRFKFSIHSMCFAIMFLLSAYIYLNYSIANPKKEDEAIKKFEEGKKKFQQLWKINRTVIDTNIKITDIIEKQETVSVAPEQKGSAGKIQKEENK